MSYKLQEILTATLVLSPVFLGMAAVWSASKGHWSAPVLATPALLFGLALGAALFNHPAGVGIPIALLYAPFLLALSIGSIVFWDRRRRR